MLRNLKFLKDRPLRAADGEIGEVSDFYFDDQHWHLRYFVVGTGTWLKRRRVLIAPEALGSFDASANVFPTTLTREQVRGSPGVETDQPVSRRQEEALRTYYGWPLYWGTPLRDGAAPPPLATDARTGGQTDGNAPWRKPGDPHLRSAGDTLESHIAATDGDVGHLDDFLLEDGDWSIRYLVVDTRNWLPGKKVIVSPRWIQRLSWRDKTVAVDLARNAIMSSPPYDPDAPWDPAYARRLHDYYGRARYSDWDKDITAGAPKVR